MAEKSDATQSVSQVDETRRDGPSVELNGLTGLLGYQLRMAQVSFQRHFDRAVQTSGLSQVQFAVLWLINANPGASQIDLAGAVGLDRAGMMAIIDRLELRNLVVRRLSTADRRRRELHLTEDGERAFAISLSAVEALEKALKAQISNEDALVFERVLRRFRE
jgi:DNA-binding MarR family transcriptional regulator